MLKPIPADIFQLRDAIWNAIEDGCLITHPQLANLEIVSPLEGTYEYGRSGLIVSLKEGKFKVEITALETAGPTEMNSQRTKLSFGPRR